MRRGAGWSGGKWLDPLGPHPAMLETKDARRGRNIDFLGREALVHLPQGSTAHVARYRAGGWWLLAGCSACKGSGNSQLPGHLQSPSFPGREILPMRSEGFLRNLDARLSRWCRWCRWGWPKIQTHAVACATMEDGAPADAGTCAASRGEGGTADASAREMRGGPEPS